VTLKVATPGKGADQEMRYLSEQNNSQVDHGTRKDYCLFSFHPLMLTKLTVRFKEARVG
jgi:hypothetical protein